MLGVVERIHAGLYVTKREDKHVKMERGGGCFRTKEKRGRYFGGYAWGPCRAIKLRNGGSPLDVWRELHSLVKASRNSRRYRHRRGYINVSSYVLTDRSLSHSFSLCLFLSFTTGARCLYTIFVWYIPPIHRPGHVLALNTRTRYPQNAHNGLITRKTLLCSGVPLTYTVSTLSTDSRDTSAASYAVETSYYGMQLYNVYMYLVARKTLRLSRAWKLLGAVMARRVIARDLVARGLNAASC